MAVEKLSVILELVSGQYKKEAREAATATGQIGTAAQTSSKGVGGLSDAFGKMKGALVAGAIAGAGAAVVKFGVDAIKAASNLSESMNAVQVVFGESAKTITDFGEQAAESAGLAQSEFQQMATVLGAALANAGFETDVMADKTIELTQRAADMASVFNTTVPDALGAIQAALRGEGDPIEKYGVSLAAAAVDAEAAALGFKKVGGQFDSQAKTAARLSLIMKQTSRVQGDFANTSDGLANKTKTLTAQFTDMQARVGTELAPAMSKLLGTAEDLLPMLEGLALGVADLVGVAGDLISVAAGASSEMEQFGLVLESDEEVYQAALAALQAERTGLDEVAIAAMLAGAQISEANTAVREAPALMEAAAEGAGGLSEKYGVMFQVTSTAAEKHQALATGIRAVISAQLALLNPVIAAVQAQEAEVVAREALNELQEGGEATARELAIAELEVAVAAAEAEGAQLLLREQGIRPTAEAFAELADESITSVIAKLRELQLIDDTDIRVIFDLDARISEQLESVLPYLSGKFGDAAGGPSITRVLPFDSGGVVPGPRGSQQLILAHGGETILPTHKAGSYTKNGPTITVMSPMNNFRQDLQYATILASVTNLVEGF